MQVVAEQQQLQAELAVVHRAIKQQERANILYSNALRDMQHHLNVTKRAQDTATITAIHRNEAWIRQKLNKNVVQAKLWTVRDQASTLQACTSLLL